MSPVKKTGQSLFCIFITIDHNLGMVMYVQVDSLETTLEKVKKLGGKVVIRPIGERYAAFADPEGNVIGIWTPEKK
jgi:predicted enzyme related to lactoylglutathione lyase